MPPGGPVAFAGVKWERSYGRKAKLVGVIGIISLTLFLFFVGFSTIVRNSEFLCQCTAESCKYGDKPVANGTELSLDFSELNENIGNAVCSDWSCPVGLKGKATFCPLILLETETPVLTIVYAVTGILTVLCYAGYLRLGQLNQQWWQTNPEAKRLRPTPVI